MNNPLKYRQLTTLADMASVFEDYYIDVADWFEEKYLESLELINLWRTWNG